MQEVSSKTINIAIELCITRLRVKVADPLVITGVDFAGPMVYKIKKRKFGKAYAALLTGASTRAVHLKLCHDLTAVGLWQEEAAHSLRLVTTAKHLFRQESGFQP